MTVSLRVAIDEYHEPFFEKTYTKKEFGRLNLGVNQDPIACKVTLLYPRRTDKKESFCVDLFFPNTAFELSQKVSNRVFVVLGFFADLFTVPIRSFTAIPRFFYNLSHAKETNIFYKYLTRQVGVDPKIHLAENSVYVIIENKNVDSRENITETVKLFYFCTSTGSLCSDSSAYFRSSPFEDFRPWHPKERKLVQEV